MWNDIGINVKIEPCQYLDLLFVFGICFYLYAPITSPPNHYVPKSWLDRLRTRTHEWTLYMGRKGYYNIHMSRYSKRVPFLGQNQNVSLGQVRTKSKCESGTSWDKTKMWLWDKLGQVSKPLIIQLMIREKNWMSMILHALSKKKDFFFSKVTTTLLLVEYF